MIRRAAVYRFYDAAGVLLYVGVAWDLGVRWSQHARSKEWWPLVCRVTADWYATRELAEAEEVRAIKAERPLHNTVHMPPAAPIPALDGPGAERRVRELAAANPVLGKVASTGLRCQQHDPEVADHIATVVAALKNGCRPTDVAEWSPFTGTYLRRLAREAGVPQAPKGGRRKPKGS